eukprot:362529-Chlamydomonas_euryale.AAC.3
MLSQHVLCRRPAGPACALPPACWASMCSAAGLLGHDCSAAGVLGQQVFCRRPTGPAGQGRLLAGSPNLDSGRGVQHWARWSVTLGWGGGWQDDTCMVPLEI